ncbi:unnamed protein product, partial [Discosporangium mesarthrocarpum]
SKACEEACGVAAASRPFIYGGLRGLKLGSSMVVRGVYTSDAVYAPGTLPRDMVLPLRRGQTWGDAYRWLWLPQAPDVDIENTSPGSVAAGAATAAKALYPTPTPRSQAEARLEEPASSRASMKRG